MKKSLNLKSFTRFSIIGAAVIALVGAVMLILMGGNTLPTFTTANLELSMFIKAAVAVVFVWALTLGYFACFYKKRALKLSLLGVMSATVSAVMAFFLCVICRSPLGDFTFAVIIFAVLLSYASTFIYSRFLFDAKPVRKSKGEIAESPEDIASGRTLKLMLYVLLISAVALAGVFAVALIFGSKILCIYALPTILTAVTSVVFTLSVGCNLIKN